jgi:hypothetical protein
LPKSKLKEASESVRVSESLSERARESERRAQLRLLTNEMRHDSPSLSVVCVCLRTARARSCPVCSLSGEGATIQCLRPHFRTLASFPQARRYSLEKSAPHKMGAWTLRLRILLPVNNFLAACACLQQCRCVRVCKRVTTTDRHGESVRGSCE